MTDGSALAFWHIIPILFGLCIFGGGILARFIFKRATEPEKDYTYQPMVSILLPVYNEGEHVLETWKPSTAFWQPIGRKINWKSLLPMIKVQTKVIYGSIKHATNTPIVASKSAAEAPTGASTRH